MGRRPNLNGIKSKLEKGNEFKMTRAQYIKSTGIDIPESKSYTERRSAVARLANEYGYQIEVVPEVLVFVPAGRE